MLPAQNDVSTSGTPLLTTNRKALTINLNDPIYGTFAEIGAGQEVVRHFFQVGSASGTVAKSMSAYDMTFSDNIYGKAPRYVSRERLCAMLKHEFVLLPERLGAARNAVSHYFSFATTVATASARRGGGAHAWMGLRFQLTPDSEPREIHVHVRLWDKTVADQQDAVGVVGVNLIFAAYFLNDCPDKFVRSLVDNVGSERVEVDFLHFEGPSLPGFCNRRNALKLVESGLTNAVVFAPDGTLRVPADFFWKKSVLIERGFLRPVANVNLDMMRRASNRMIADGAVKPEDLMRIFEITLNPCKDAERYDYDDLLARADLVNALGFPVLFSDYREFYRLSEHFRRYMIGGISIVTGVNNLVDIFSDIYYGHLDGGVLEACGRLFKANVRLYVYPMRLGRLRQLAGAVEAAAGMFDSNIDGDEDAVITADKLPMRPAVSHLFAHLLANGLILPLETYDDAALSCSTRTLADRIHNDEPGWEHEVPEVVAEIIRERRPWGGHGVAAP